MNFPNNSQLLELPSQSLSIFLGKAKNREKNQLIFPPFPAIKEL